MGDLKNSKLMYLKAALFTAIGAVSIFLLMVRHFEWQSAVLIALAVWSLCRAYYFAFYVIENYIDSDYKFSGLASLVTYWFKKQTTHKTIKNKGSDK
jgi:hypothetical protein